MKRIALAAGIVALLAPALSAPSTVAPATAAAPAVKVTDRCLRSVPDPGGAEEVRICYTIFKPAAASRRSPVPMILHSHGWGGARVTDPARFSRWLDAGYGVLSFDQRGFGESGGHAYVENPDVEGHDVQALVRRISRLGWVRQDGRRDPRLGAIGGSYGGGYQFLAAFTSMQRRGRPVLDALAPEITWHDLNQSLAPQGVIRDEWALALSAASLPSQALPPHVYKALVEGAATGDWPDGSIPGTEDMVSFFAENGPRFHIAEGRRLPIPVLFGQGTTDTLFNLQQGLANWDEAITDRARRRSIFVAYNGGHVLPAVLPRGVEVTSDPCSRKLAGGTFEELALRFMDEQLRGRRTGLRGYGRLHFATPGSGCTSVRSHRADTRFEVGTLASPTAAGPPVAVKVAEGPLRLAGSAYLTGTMTALGVSNRAFYGLAVGTGPAEARLVQNNVLPVNEPSPVLGEPRRVELPAVAVDVPAGQSLFVLVSAFSDTFAGMGSRTPGAVVLQDTAVHLPVVSR